MARFLLFFLLVLLVGSPSARASLGATEDSLEKDRVSIKAAAVKSTKAEAYTTHEFLSGGLQVREYASPDGTVFAVTWHGAGNPDLSTLLGSYFGDYEVAKRKLAPSKKRRTFGRVSYSTVTGEKVVVKTFGHMRSARGLAYAPKLVPQRVSPNDLQ